MRKKQKTRSYPTYKIEDISWKKPAIALYDSGSNISLMNYEFYKKEKMKKGISGGENIEGVSGVAKSEGIVSVLIKIFDIEKYFPFFIVKSRRFKDDLLLGLDLIQPFKLRQDEK